MHLETVDACDFDGFRRRVRSLRVRSYLDMMQDVRIVDVIPFLR